MLLKEKFFVFEAFLTLTMDLCKFQVFKADLLLNRERSSELAIFTDEMSH